MSDEGADRQSYFNHLVSNPSDSDGLRVRKQRAFARRNDGMRVYKYCGVDTAQKIVESGRILLRAPDDFNDPFDCLARVGVFAPEYRFPPEEDDIQYALALMGTLPEKYQLQTYQVFNDMRTSYCFAITCFGERHDNHLMWSHYANNHKGLCLAFDVGAVLDDIHPCFYASSMPQLNWTSGNLALSLIKGNAWAYEEEWRLIRKTIRPKMRVIGSITHQIYNAVHSNPAFSMEECKGWSEINSRIHKRLEEQYDEERRVSIAPTEIFLGLNFGYNYANTVTAEACESIRRSADVGQIPVRRMRVPPNSFDLVAVPVPAGERWSNLL